MTANIHNQKKLPVICVFIFIAQFWGKPLRMMHNRSPHYILSILKQKYFLKVFALKFLLSWTPSTIKVKVQWSFSIRNKEKPWVNASIFLLWIGIKYLGQFTMPKTHSRKSLVFGLSRAPGKIQGERDYLGKPIKSWPWITFGFAFKANLKMKWNVFFYI